MRTAHLLTAARAPTVPITTQHQPTQQQHSAWHSPVPYLFGGLAAMLGLIAFALLILACSYWKLSGYLEDGNNGSNGGADLESGDGKTGDTGAAKAAPHAQEQTIVVIMAGDKKPTVLATPMSSLASTFGESKSKSSDEKETKEEKKPETEEARGDGDSEDTHDGHRQPEETTHQSQEETQHDQDQGPNLEQSHQSVDRDH